MKLFKSVFGAILVVSFLQIGYSCSSDFHRFNDELDEIKVDGAKQGEWLVIVCLL